jgi:hypothetical protein
VHVSSGDDYLHREPPFAFGAYTEDTRRRVLLTR